MNGKSLQVVLSSLIVFGVVGLSSASIIVDQPPAQLGGSGSDTLGRDFFGEEIWQRAADNIVLDSNAVVGGVNWWGFYGSDDLPHAPPVSNEVFRVRFYSARPNGLPDESSILYEESILNPLRTSTGRTIAVQGRPDEYLYEVALAHPVALSMSQLYWLEIAQIGDVESWFRWETGFGAVPQHALINYLVTDWRISSGSYAFQLVAVPEPGAAMLLLLGSSLLMGRARNLRRSRLIQPRDVEIRGERFRTRKLATYTVLFLCCQSASASVVFEQLPRQLGGLGSDTEFLDDSGIPIWQQEADSLVLLEDEIVESVRWWGFYGSDDQNHQPPTGDETLRIRFLNSGQDGLPNEDSVIYSESFLNLERLPTGRHILVQGEPQEFEFHASLTHPVHLLAGVNYWMEIVQLGDPQSTFRWEMGTSLIPGHAVLNIYMPVWRASTGGFAFQLTAVPEPGTALLLLLQGSLLLGSARSLRRSWVRQTR